MPKIKQLFFDCDNTLVISEEPAFETTSDLVNTILAEHGIKERYTTEHLLVEFVGQSFRRMMLSLQKRHHFTITPENIRNHLKSEDDAVTTRMLASTRPTTGSKEVIEQLRRDHKYSLAVVSSSALGRIRACLQKVGHDKFFHHDRVFSAVTSLEKPKGKPSPAIYLHALEKLGLRPEECVTVEDSRSGATAAVRANVPCIAYVGSYSTRHKQDIVARILTKLGCRAVMYHWSEFFDCLRKIEQA